MGLAALDGGWWGFGGRRQRVELTKGVVRSGSFGRLRLDFFFSLCFVRIWDGIDRV